MLECFLCSSNKKNVVHVLISSFVLLQCRVAPDTQVDVTGSEVVRLIKDRLDL